VLYPLDGDAVPWNGLISVNETLGQEVKSYYIDGVKFLDQSIPGAYFAKLSAFTYPDELDELVGIGEFAPGVFVHDQQTSKFFNLSYRTMVGNDSEGFSHGYKIHILYNLLAVLSDTTMGTIGESVAPQVFEWSVSGTPPPPLIGIRPTSHISLDSRRLDPERLATLEATLYGSEDQEPNLPNFNALLGFVS
jgi:hypothetical protein